MTLKQVVEALVFASPKPLSTKEILAALKSAGNPEKTEDPVALELAKTKEDGVLAVLAEIQNELQSSGRAFRLMEQVNGWAFVTDPAAVHWVRQLYPEAKPTRLTGPQLETLAIIAYRQPVTRADCEAVRGVAVDGVVQVLMERSLIKIAGRADVPGRPLLYETTEYFLQHFGLKTVSELPNSSELRRVELPKAEYAEPAAEGAKPKGKKAKEAAEAKKDAPVADPAPAEPADAAKPAHAEAAAPEAAEESAGAAEPEIAAEPKPVEVPIEAPDETVESVDAHEPVEELAPEPTAPEPEPTSEPDPASEHSSDHSQS
jgi:segregation and condensation protein B